MGKCRTVGLFKKYVGPSLWPEKCRTVELVPISMAAPVLHSCYSTQECRTVELVRCDSDGPTFVNVGPSLPWLLGTDGPTYCGLKSQECRTVAAVMCNFCHGTDGPTFWEKVGPSQP